MGRAPAVLVALAVALIAWYEVVPHLGRTSDWTSIILISVLVMPALFALAWLALPWWNNPACCR